MAVIALLVSLLTVSCSGSDDSQQTQRPNILVIMADDAGWNDVGYHGSEIETPNIDSMASSGVALSRFYVAPTCSPTRAAFLTGMPASRMGIVVPISGRSKKALPDSITTLPQALQQAGYQTALMGKWHLGLTTESGPGAYGFDYSYGFLHGQIDQYTHNYKNGDASWYKNGKLIDEEGHATDLITQEAIDWLSQKRDQNSPFFLQVAYSAPHTPLQEEEKWKERYQGVISDTSRLDYAAAMTHMDHGIGQLIATLKKEGLEENTLVLFMSDNGAQEEWVPDWQYDGKFGPNRTLGSNQPYRGWKTSNYEGGIRVPAVLYWDGQLNQGAFNKLVNVTDLMPTFLALAGVDTQPCSIEGRNIWPQVSGQDQDYEKEREVYIRGHLQESFITQGWKIIRTRHPDEEPDYELYQLAEDPQEINNVMDKYPKKVAGMKKRLEQEFSADADSVNYTIE
ncbi:sulfatase-like hydrolase/transferase [Fodinibius salsisoli]|uniref:Sulfatase-like hydrolase/transferase n=1 Tax=Fodinibius salsisoli TaxID=2820877 RepID=A0ABT3PHA2_9BACT|nr:sulfatase-like hydrolase/transferase [Fodinibius salsisoli]MCW9705297.1 sulfatase-like hydrolase/transferase [Fodinibius salsisoli]